MKTNEVIEAMEEIRNKLEGLAYYTRFKNECNEPEYVSQLDSVMLNAIRVTSLLMTRLPMVGEFDGRETGLDRAVNACYVIMSASADYMEYRMKTNEARIRIVEFNQANQVFHEMYPAIMHCKDAASEGLL